MWAMRSTMAAGTARPAGPWRRALADHGEARVGEGRVTVGDRSWDAAIRFDADGVARVSLDGVERRYAVAASDDTVWIARDGHHLELRTASVARSEAAAIHGSLEAPMPGTVLLVNVAEGETVAEGDVLIVLESMKMELSIVAPHDGTVAGLELQPGDRVALKQSLVAIVDRERGGAE